MPLPYPGYTWSLSQHQDKITARDLYGLLAAAIAARNSEHPNAAGDEFLAELVRRGAVNLSSNIREGRGRPWRDYQQLLPEIGLMVSTDVEARPELTILGKVFYDRTLGFDELITTQVLRYQYPNGNKTHVPARVAAQFASAGSVRPESRVHADLSAGVLLRPGLLILRLLLELAKTARPPSLSVDQLQQLVTIRRNSEWPEALATVLSGQGERGSQKRNFQDWIKFLTKSTLFERERAARSDGVRLSEVALASIEYLEKLLQQLEKPSSFWTPTPGALLEGFRRDWFDYYGAPPLEEMWAPNPQVVNRDYELENYVAGFEREEDTREAPITLSPFEEFEPSDLAVVRPVDVAAVLLGRYRQSQSRVLHDEIVTALGERLAGFGFTVTFDPNSVDVVAQKGDQLMIFEVKTLGPRNVVPRLRLGIGQLIEYRRRFEIQFALRPSCTLVISVPALPPTLNYWSDVASEGAGIGLMGYERGRFRAHTNGALESRLSS